MVRYIFLDEGAHDLYVDWESAARGALANLRLYSGRYPHDPRLAELVGELSIRDGDFRRWRAEHDVFRHTYGVKRLHHPLAGELTLGYEALIVTDDPEQTLGLHTADPDSPFGQALRLLANWTGEPAVASGRIPAVPTAERPAARGRGARRLRLRSGMREPLTLAVAQPPCRPYDVAANARAHAAAVRAAGARVVVFPELSLTGYELDAPALTAGDERLGPLLEACADEGALALAGAPVPGAGNRSHIGVLAVDGNGVTVAYRKMWLGGAEPQWFAPGDTPAVLDVDGWRLGLAVCKDTGVPRHASDTAALGIDAYLAGAVDSVEDAGVQDERARRIAADHGVGVAIASVAGSTGGGYTHTAGRSRIWNPDGRVVAEAGAQAGAVAHATLT